MVHRIGNPLKYMDFSERFFVLVDFHGESNGFLEMLGRWFILKIYGRLTHLVLNHDNALRLRETILGARMGSKFF